MTAFDSILVAADFGIEGQDAVHRAARLARQHDARLHIVELPPSLPSRVRGATRSQPDTLHRRVALEIAERYALRVSAEAVQGDTAEGLLRAAQQADLVVIGQAQRGFVDAWLRARMLRRLLRHCTRPVLVVRTPPDAPYQRVLVPVDFAAGAHAAVAIAARMAGAADLHLFHAIDPAGLGAPQRTQRSEAATREARARARAGAHARLRRTVWRLGLERCAVDYTVTHGAPARAMQRQLRHIGADLLVHPREPTCRAGWAPGAAHARLAPGAGCDLLVLPSPREENPAEPYLGIARTDSWLHNAAPLRQRRSA